MGISKIGPNEYFIKARVKLRGEDRRKRERFKGSKAQAEERYLAIKAELRGDVGAATREIKTFGDAMRFYLEYKRKKAIPSGQRTIFDTLLRDIGDVDLRQLRNVLEDYGANLKERMSSRGRAYSDATQNRFRGLVSAILVYCVRKGRIAENPLLKAAWDKEEEPSRDRILSVDETLRLLATIDQEAPHLRPIVRFALAVPSRKGELVAARRDWLNMLRWEITVPGEFAKGGCGSTKPVPPALRPYFTRIPASCEWLFFREDGGRFHPLGDFKKSLTRCLRLAGIKDFRFHDTRHCAATALAKDGNSPFAIQRVGGWKSQAMVSRYTNLTGADAAEMIKFPSGVSPAGGNQGATTREESEKRGEYGTERAVS